jgi:DNA-binding transcriptional LysR family regulator
MRKDALVAQKILTYRHQLVASPAYLERSRPPESPHGLLGHKLLAFSQWTRENIWNFYHVNGKDRKTLTFRPHLAMNDYAGLASALLAGAGIGDLPSLVQPALLRDGRLVEVMPSWRFRSLNLSVVHLGNRFIPRAVRAFKQHAAQMAPLLFPALPT